MMAWSSDSVPSTPISSQCSNDTGIFNKCGEVRNQFRISSDASTASQFSDEDASEKCQEPLFLTSSKAPMTTANLPETGCAPVRKSKSAKRSAHSQRCDDEDFGSEFCRWAQEKLAGEPSGRQDLLEALQGHGVTLAFHPWGCRVMQYALDAADDVSRVLLADELRGHALTACLSLHANFVLSKIVEVVPPTGSQWIFEELRSNAVLVARDNRGCRVLSRLFARPDIWEDPASAAESLIGEVLGSAAELCYHPFGQHVIEAAFVSGSDRHRSTIFAALHGKCARMSKNRHASYMVQRALVVCGPQERAAVANEILGRHKTLMVLCQDQFGHHVVRTALGVPGQQAAQAARRIASEHNVLRKSKFGSKLLEEIDSIVGPF